MMFLPMRAFRLSIAGFVVVAFLLGGCSGPNLKTAQVKGRVTVGSQPLPDIQVTFIPEEGRPAMGITDADGNFSLSTLSANDGAVPGKHQVRFYFASTASEADSSAPPPESESLPFHAKYASKRTSGITAEVLEGKLNEFTWDLDK
jgi:hypothetical protein